MIYNFKFFKNTFFLHFLSFKIYSNPTPYTYLYSDDESCTSDFSSLYEFDMYIVGILI